MRFGQTLNPSWLGVDESCGRSERSLQRRRSKNSCNGDSASTLHTIDSSSLRISFCPGAPSREAELSTPTASLCALVALPSFARDRPSRPGLSLP